MDHDWRRQCDQLGVDASPPATNVPVSSSFLSDQSGGVPFDIDIDLILANMDAEEFPIQGSSAEESPCYSNPEFQFIPDRSSSYMETGDGPTIESIPHTTTSNQNFSASRTNPWNITTTNYHNEQTIDQTDLSCNLTLHPVLLADPEVRSRSLPIPSWRNGDVASITTTRLSRESLQILKKWPGLNSRHTYPSEEETEMLQRRTGLSKTQIANWIVNARRRGKLQPKRSSGTQSLQAASTGPIDIPRRPDTPAAKGLRPSQDPLQRWVDSPPEDEPASVVAIARAMHAKRWDPSSAAFASNYSPTTQEGIFSNDSSASSVGTSSAGSFAHSHSSDGSFQVSTFNSLNQINGRRRRRKRVMPSRSNQRTSLIVPLKPYQCTFCPETFKTKHDWQRHEKSFHLSLEMWICTPDEPRVINPNTQQLCCVFCGLPDPDDAHLEKHHHGNVCKMRKFEERTFYRKDHLNQHLKLVLI
ncbi:unnamed protein product [Clonostachys rhizophaga]|uniref:Uncharacterized protein n=1 Tax=Clonostachys rhizophaga TaxID=160324 RepID=A0A9N9VE85_9HYPO|nr:unnamed protein product [Clonostachys rhizophaga]